MEANETTQHEDFRLGERQRSWESPALTAPPLGQTQSQLARRWEQLADVRRAVCDEIDRSRDAYIDLLQALVRIPSVNPSPEMTKPLATFVAERMRGLGMDVRQMETVPNNVSNLGRLAGTNHDGATEDGGLGSLLYYAHLDTVPAGDERNWRFPPFSATIADGRLYGRGAKDCKLGMAAALAAASAVRGAEIQLAGDLLIVTPCDEETGGHLGIGTMIDAGWLEGIDACIYGEGRAEQLTIGAKGGVDFRVTVRGRSAHTSRKEMGVNAILHAAAVAQAIDAISFDDYTEHLVVPGGPIASVNLIAGGFKLNVVPDSCTLDVDLRFPPGYTADQALAHVRHAIEQLRADPRYRELDAEITLLSLMRPYAMQPEQPVVQALGMAVENVTGTAPVARGMVASSDARWIFLDAHIPTVNFSFGNESAHLPNEYVDVDGYIANIKAYALANLLLLA